LCLFLFARGKVGKGFLRIEPLDTFWTGLEVEPQRAFDSDLAIAKISNVKYLGVFALRKS